MRAFFRAFFSFKGSKPLFFCGLAIAALGFLILATVSHSVGVIVALAGGMMVALYKNWDRG